VQNEYQETRTGEDRRRPTHCDVHQESLMKIDSNGTELASIRSSIGTLKWVAGFAVPIFMAAIGTFYTLTYDSLKTISSDTKELKNMMTAGQIASAAQASQFNQRLLTVEHDIQEIEAVMGRKGKRK
jgi:hypothetical protein